MKKKFLRLTALALALVMCFGVTAFAAEENNTADDSNALAEIFGANGAVVSFATNGEKEERITVTYESTDIKEGQFYLVMVVAETKDETTGEVSYIPTKDTILYINQTVGQAGKIVFGSETDNVIYPSAIKDSAILIYGSNVAGEDNFLIAAVIDAKYIIGDVDKSGTVDIGDAVAILRYLAKYDPVGEFQAEAGDVDNSGGVDIGDVVKLLRVFALYEEL